MMMPDRRLFPRPPPAPLPRRPSVASPVGDAARTDLRPGHSIMPAPSRRARALTATIVAAVSAAAVLALAHAQPGIARDFDQLWFGAHAVMRGADPYALVGPGRAFEWRWPLYYPLPALLVTLPLAWAPVAVARALFVAASAGACTMAFTRDGWHRWPALLSFAFVTAVSAAQWSPLLAAAFVYPALAWLWVAKPTVGLAAVAASPSARSAPLAAAAGVVALAASLLLQPGWVGRWLSAAGDAPHITAPVTRLGGVLLLAAAVRWRRPEARLLLALACVPATPGPYEAIPLFFVAANTAQSVLLSALTYAHLVVTAAVVTATSGPSAPWQDAMAVSGRVMMLSLYLPCLVMVLRRPNEGPVPPWLAWIVARAAGARARRRPRPGGAPAT